MSIFFHFFKESLPQEDDYWEFNLANKKQN